jgi:hypothetical protein
MACEDAACADLLLARGATLDALNDAGETAFHIATQEFREDMIAWLTAQYAARGLVLPVVPIVEDEDEEGDRDFGSLPDEGAEAP